MEQLKDHLEALGYEDVDRVYADVMAVMSQPVGPVWRAWTTVVEEYQGCPVISLHGGLMIKYMSEKMILPVRLVVPHLYPKLRPILRLRTSDQSSSTLVNQSASNVLAVNTDVLKEENMPVVYVSEGWSDVDLALMERWKRSSTIATHSLTLTVNEDTINQLREAIETQLHSAARDGNMDVVRRLLERFGRGTAQSSLSAQCETDDADTMLSITGGHGLYNINYWVSNKDSDKYTKTALHIAVEYGHPDIVRLLLDQGAQIHPKITVSSIVEAFSHPIWRSHVWLMEEVLVKVAGYDELQHIDEYMCVVMHEAACLGNLAVVCSLIEMGLGNVTRVLHVMIEEGIDERIMDAVIDSGADVNAQTYHSRFNCDVTPICAASSIASSWPYYMLINYGADLYHVDADEKTALHYAGNEESAVALLSRGLDVNSRDKFGRTPLFYVKDVDSMRVLITYGAALDATDSWGRTALHLQALYADANAISRLCLLMSAGASVTAQNVDGNTPLHVALWHHKTSQTFTSALQTSLTKTEWGKVFQTTSTGGKTMLHTAALHRSCSADCLGILLQYAVQTSCPDVVNRKDNCGRTALHCAVMANDVSKVKRLLTIGAAANEQDDDGGTCGHTALHTAIADCNRKAIRCDVNIRDIKGQTALHYAAIDGAHIKTVQALLEQGADKSLLDNKGHEAAHYATKKAVKQLLTVRKRKRE